LKEDSNNLDLLNKYQIKEWIYDISAMKKKLVEVKNKTIHFDGKAIPLLSGEIHYWRLNPKYWEKCLDETKRMGLDVIATYVCWDFCEVERGKFDFTGETSPHHDLISFLKLAQSKGLWVIFRPGPYIYSEWDEMGIPKYAAKYHRDSDEFKKLALPYMKAVTDAAKIFQATCGGPIILWQADNEIDFMPWAYEGVLGLADHSGGFQKFLKDEYKTIIALNKAWGTSYNTFDEARATQTRRIKEAPYHRRYMDFMRYRHSYNTKHAKWMVDTYRSLGVKVPVYLNSYPHQDSLDWRGLQQVADVVGIDPYPANEFSDDEGDHKRFVEKVVFQNCFAAVPYLAEYEAGVWYGHHKFTSSLTSNHYRLSCLSAIGGGIAGWNWYMLVNRDNWVFGPINERGIPTDDIAPAFREIVKTFKTMNPPALKRITNTAVTFDLMHHALRDISEDDPALDGLYRASVPYEFYDFRTGEIAKPLMIYSGPDWLSADSAKRLRKYVENGGNLIFFINYPRHNEDYAPESFFGLLMPDMTLPRKSLRIKIGSESFDVSSESFAYTKLPDEIITAENLQTVNCEQGKVALGEKYNIGCVQNIGKGKVLFLAIQPDTNTILAIHDYFGISVPCRALDKDTNATLFTGDNKAFIVIVNMKACPTIVPVQIDCKYLPRKRLIFEDILSGKAIDTVEKNGSLIAYVPVGKKDAAAIQIQ
jgi:hypothetical protein